MKDWKKSLAWFGMGTLPMVVCIVLQMIIGFVVMAVFAFVHAFSDVMSGGGGDTEAIMEALMEGALGGAGPSLLFYHLGGIIVFGFWYYMVCLRPGRGGQKGAAMTLAAAGWSVVTGIILCVFSTELVRVGGYFFPATVTGYLELLEQAGIGISIAAAIAVIFLAPIGEELLCRGIIQHYAMKATSRFWVANVFQALLFGVMHMNIVQGVYAFCIGLVLGWLRHRYKTLWVPIIIHFVNNLATSTWLGYLLEQIPEGVAINSAALMVAIAVMAAILFHIGREEGA